MSAWETLQTEIVACSRCERLRDYCQQIAREKRRAFAADTYWGRPVPDLGSGPARLLVVGLAPAAHGANRTGRMFTGDRSGQWLYRALHKAGFANQSQSTHLGDGLRLIDCVVSAACHCAPPDNKPSRDELAACANWLEQSVALVSPQVIVALGQIAWRAVWQLARARRWQQGALPRFGHLESVALTPTLAMIGSYHPSQQNTFTGRLTEPMFDRVFAAARRRLT